MLRTLLTGNVRAGWKFCVNVSNDKANADDARASIRDREFVQARQNREAITSNDNDAPIQR
jgi:hypothetical protein